LITFFSVQCACFAQGQIDAEQPLAKPTAQQRSNFPPKTLFSAKARLKFDSKALLNKEGGCQTYRKLSHARKSRFGRGYRATITLPLPTSDGKQK